MMHRVRQLFATKQNAEAALPQVAVVGGLRCGTNYLKFLVEQAFYARAEFNLFGWKHAGVPIIAFGSSASFTDVPLIYISKNPYAFSVSLYRYYQRKVTQGHKISLDTNCAGDFRSFLTSPIWIFDSQSDGSPHLHFSNPIQYWNFLYGNLASLNPKTHRAIGFRYEDLIAAPERIRRAGPVTGLAERDGALDNPENQLKRLSGAQRAATVGRFESSEAFDPNYYSKKLYLDKLIQDDIAFIGQNVDGWVMTQRGYEIL